MKRLLPVVAALVALTPSVRADDWPQWLGPNRNGASAEKGLLATFPKSGPAVAWLQQALAGSVVAVEFTRYAGPIDLLLAENGNPKGPIFHEVDPSRLAILGHSLGGAVATLVAALDSRIKVLAVEGPNASDETFLGAASLLTVPVLAMDGSLDLLAPAATCSDVVLARALSADKASIVVKGGCHTNCPSNYNPDQADCDHDGVGDVCTIANCKGDPSCMDCNGNGVPDGCELTGGILYVNAAAQAGGDGTTWATAFVNLQDALAGAECSSYIHQIWVAAGTYTPDRGGNQTQGDRSATITLQSGIALFGGFGTWRVLRARPVPYLRSE